MIHLREDKFHEECGVFGAHGHPDAAHLTYLGLFALQHRGQEGAGIATREEQGGKLHLFKGMGLVAEVFHDEEVFARFLPGDSAIGHNRYSTSGGSKLSNVQPLMVEYSRGEMAIAHNGNLVNAGELRRTLQEEGAIFQTTSDSEIIIHLIARSRRGTFVDRAIEALGTVQGAFSVLLMDQDQMIAARDPMGFRPLSMGRIGDAVIFASETCALDLIGATWERDLAPGEMVVVTPKETISFFPFPERPLKQCIFEYIYFSRPDSILFGKSVHQVRKALGHQLAREAPAMADLVLPVPDSGMVAALGFAEEAGIAFDMAMIRNHYIGRTFIQPLSAIRNFGVRVKLNPVRAVLEGKRVVVVDDSIVRGTTSRKIIKMIRKAGATEVHFRISSPPTIFPCFYGIDTPTRKELIASTHNLEQIASYLEVDSVAYLSHEGMLAAVESTTGEGYCHACFSGDYPIGFPRGDVLQPHLFEGGTAG